MSFLRVKNTRVEVKALTDKGRESLGVVRNDIEVLASRVRSKDSSVSPEEKSFVNSLVHVFIPKTGLPEKHDMLGFKRMSDGLKKEWYLRIKNAMTLNGCTLDDFEVRFYDE